GTLTASRVGCGGRFKDGIDVLSSSADGGRIRAAPLILVFLISERVGLVDGVHDFVRLRVDDVTNLAYSERRGIAGHSHEVWSREVEEIWIGGQQTAAGLFDSSESGVVGAGGRAVVAGERAFRAGGHDQRKRDGADEEQGEHGDNQGCSGLPIAIGSGLAF